ncbi:MAG: N-6 DNA methylase [Promethearchaeota archaeon]
MSNQVPGLTFGDLVAPTDQTLVGVFEDLLVKIVVADNEVTRREDQLDQLCNVLLLKLESDREGKQCPAEPVFFRPMGSVPRTAAWLRGRYVEFVDRYPEVFTTEKDRGLRLGDDTLASCVEALHNLKLLDLGVSTVSTAFQVLRSEALKQGEGQYFTPKQVIEAGVRLLRVDWDDVVIDPACGTGGFLVQVLLEMKRRKPGVPDDELAGWAQTHVFGIEKDAIGVKLAKATMLIAGDGSAHCVRGDSVRTHAWGEKFPHLNDGSFRDGRFSVVVTNPPFGKNLRVSAGDARSSGLQIAKKGKDEFHDLEIGLIFLERAYNLLKPGGVLGIVLPETYFFSPSYAFLMDWLRTRFRPVVVANIPMEAFQGFCRAKTNFYVFEKIGGENEDPKAHNVTFINPRTCGIYKNGGTRFKTDPVTGERTGEVDNELIEYVDHYLNGEATPGVTEVPLARVLEKRVLVPTYYDERFFEPVVEFLDEHGIGGKTLGDLIDEGVISVHSGHGSPGNDQRNGSIPYIKVSDIRALRVNVNPTNLVPESVARRLWKGPESGLREWDVLTPNRASSNIGEFAIILPGEERVVVTKEVLILRVEDDSLYDPFYLLWALSLQVVRNQWRRIALMQTNREDCGRRYREITIPAPPNKEWATDVSGPFRDYFTSLAGARERFKRATAGGPFEYVASASPFAAPGDDELRTCRR